MENGWLQPVHTLLNDISHVTYHEDAPCLEESISERIDVIRTLEQKLQRENHNKDEQEAQWFSRCNFCSRVRITLILS